MSLPPCAARLLSATSVRVSRATTVLSLCLVPPASLIVMFPETAIGPEYRVLTVPSVVPLVEGISPADSLTIDIAVSQTIHIVQISQSLGSSTRRWVDGGDFWDRVFPPTAKLDIIEGKLLLDVTGATPKDQSDAYFSLIAPTSVPVLTMKPADSSGTSTALLQGSV
jgi:hypothetical protein